MRQSLFLSPPPLATDAAGVAPIVATVALPGSKSISNRALLLAALADGDTQLTNLLASDDTRHMLNALQDLGVKVALDAAQTSAQVAGGQWAGVGTAPTAPKTLFLGNAGTAMRPLCAALCLTHGEYVLTGEPRMRERPIGHLVDALRQMGAQIDYLGAAGYPPLAIHAAGLQGGEIVLDGSISSQFLTAVLLAAPLAKGDSTLHIQGELVSKPYITLTLAMMARFGVQVTHDNFQRFYVAGGQRYQSPGRWLVEGDASSASYFLAAGALAGKVTVTGVGARSVQGDGQFAAVLEQMGARITWGEDFICAERPRAGQALRGVDLDLNAIPDAAMTLATLALFADGPTTLRNIGNWRVKETDRLAAMACELRKVGAEVVEGADCIAITPPITLKHAQIATYNDHRMAMCFALLAFAPSGVTIEDPACCAKTFPQFFAIWQQIRQGAALGL
ncbi:MAG: 3-phosphoshikimate 1-carboxyvinyltransferase [Aeromonas sp.]